MTEEILALLARNLPGYEVRSVRALGDGLDNVAFEINGGLILRKSKEADPASRAESVRREAGLLAVVAGLSTLPVPEPVFFDPEADALAYRKLRGVLLMENPVADPARLAPDLGRFLGRLHQTPPEQVDHLVERDAYPPTAWLEDARDDYRKFSEHLTAESRRRIEGFLSRRPPAETHVTAFCHNDFGAEHILVDVEANTVTGVIDWTDASITDPARDLALVYRDLGPDVCELTLAHYEGHFDDADRERAGFYARCKTIEDIAYGLSTPGARRYAEAGLAHLGRTFEPFA